MIAPAPNPTDLLKLLLDETRLAVAGLVAVKPRRMDDLANQLPVKRADLERQVNQLVAFGLLTREDGQICLDVKALRGLKQDLFARPVEPTPETPEAQVLATFVRGGRIVQLPAQFTKRVVVLRWLADQFAPDRDYSEAEVNELLAGHSEDHATLRRYLVDLGLVTRQAGRYRKAVEAAG
jgi:hypothetical protein